MLELSHQVCDKLVMFVPRNMDLMDVSEAVSDIDYKIMVHVEEMWMGQRLKALSLFFEKEYPDNAGNVKDPEPEAELHET